MRANVVFDLDGTLIDSLPDIHASANRLLAARGLAPIALETARGFIGQGAPAFVDRLAQARAIPEADRPALLADFLEGYDDAVTLTHPYPGVGAALAEIGRTARLGICTNKPHRPSMAVLRHLRLEGVFDVVLGGDSLPVRKPDPRPLHETLARMGPGAAVFVGDSETDAETARRAGVPFALFTRGYRKAAVAELPHDAAFDDFADLPGIVAALVARAG